MRSLPTTGGRLLATTLMATAMSVSHASDPQLLTDRHVQTGGVYELDPARWLVISGPADQEQPAELLLRDGATAAGIQRIILGQGDGQLGLLTLLGGPAHDTNLTHTGGLVVGSDGGVGRIDVSAATLDSTGGFTIGGGSTIDVRNGAVFGFIANSNDSLGGGSGVAVVNVSGTGSSFEHRGGSVWPQFGAGGGLEINVTDGGRLFNNARFDLGVQGSARVNIDGPGSLWEMPATWDNQVWAVTGHGADIRVTNGGRIVGGGFALGEGGSLLISGEGSRADVFWQHQGPAIRVENGGAFNGISAILSGHNIVTGDGSLANLAGLVSVVNGSLHVTDHATVTVGNDFNVSNGTVVVTDHATLTLNGSGIQRIGSASTHSYASVRVGNGGVLSAGHLRIGGDDRGPADLYLDAGGRINADRLDVRSREIFTGGPVARADISTADGGRLFVGELNVGANVGFGASARNYAGRVVLAGERGAAWDVTGDITVTGTTAAVNETNRSRLTLTDGAAFDGHISLLRGGQLHVVGPGAAWHAPVTGPSAVDGQIVIRNGGTVAVPGISASGSTQARVSVEGAGSILTTGSLVQAGAGAGVIISAIDGGRVTNTGATLVDPGSASASITSSQGVILTANGTGSLIDLQQSISSQTAPFGIFHLNAVNGGSIRVGQLDGTLETRMNVSGAGSSISAGDVLWRSVQGRPIQVSDGGRLDTGNLTISMSRYWSVDHGNPLAVSVTGDGSRLHVDGNLLVANDVFRQEVHTGTSARWSHAGGIIRIGGGGLLEVSGVTMLQTRGASSNVVGMSTDVPINITLDAGGTLRTHTLALNGHADAFSWNGGTVELTGGTIIGWATNTLTVNTARTLAGTGTINQYTDVHGTLSPGNSGGTLTFTNGLRLDPSATVVFELGGDTPDLISVTGGVLAGRGLMSPGPEATFHFLIDASLTPGDYLLVAGRSLLRTSDLRFTSNLGGLDGRFFTDAGGLYFSVTAIPEPATATIMAAMVLGMLQRRRR
jgi:fibronectin-binding autotransporter adhesin